uniref:Uncharacterized protein n=1 Tax=Solanum lycopersicum TaxID=4081 RepID=A0A3Q7H629_SOLLC
MSKKLYDSAAKLRLPDFPAFALECLPNRNSLVYEDLYQKKHQPSSEEHSAMKVCKTPLTWEQLLLLFSQACGIYL